MRFWDSSAVVPLLVEEETTERIAAAYGAEDGVLVWWATEVECASALARLEREGALDRHAVGVAMRRLDALAGSWNEIEPSGPIRETARRLLRTQDLRAADSLQLAAALAACEGRPASLGFVSLDERLCVAAEREGFEVLDRGGLLT